MRSGRPGAAGFAYLLLLAAVAVISVAAAASVSMGAAVERHAAERQLLAIGGEYQRAIRSYAGAAANVPTQQVQGPRRLEDLLKDPRVPGVKRHLRRIYADPLTGKPEWGTVTNAQGQITGVYSLAAGRPLKQAGFDAAFGTFEQADTYRDWVFGYATRVPPPASR